MIENLLNELMCRLDEGITGTHLFGSLNTWHINQFVSTLLNQRIDVGHGHLGMKR